MKTVTVKEYTN